MKVKDYISDTRPFVTRTGLVPDLPLSQAVFVRSALNYDVDAASNAAAQDYTGEVSLTVQSERDETDINVIVKRFGVTGQLPVNNRTPTYGDFTGINDYQTALNVVRAADENFMSLPADIRARFHNNPQEFLEFCEDENNADEAIKLGLATKRVLPDNADASSVSDTVVKSGDSDAKAKSG